MIDRHISLQNEPTESEVGMPFDKSDVILTYPEDDEPGLGAEFSAAALDVLSLTNWILALGNIALSHYSGAKWKARVRLLFTELDARVKKLETQRPEDSSTMRAQSKSPHFREAVIVATEASVRASNDVQVRRLAAVLAGSLTPSKWADPNDDLAAMIRNVAQLGEVDIRVLGIMEETFRGVYGREPDLVTNQFSEHIDDLTKAIHKAGMHQDDFYGTCLRLSGFGLATEDRPTIRAGGERCFRPTRRGLSLLGCLRDLGSEK